MLDSLTTGLSEIIRKIRGQTRFTKKNITEISAQIRDTLIDADVAVAIADDLVEQVCAEAIGHKVLDSLTPSQGFVGVVHRHLTAMLGSEASPIAKPLVPPCPILLAGLQGTGKTTTTAKLAIHLKKQKSRVLVASTDVKRPAAIEQLRQLCAQGAVEFHEPEKDLDQPLARASAALAEARAKLADYVLIDTAGRNIMDAQLMTELNELTRAVLPAESLLVLDATQGQEALATAKAFNEVLALTGLIVTKLDGETRGGAVISAKAVLGYPVKMVGTGEGLEALEEFIPDRMASRILGMGDIMGLIEQANRKITRKSRKALDVIGRKNQPQYKAGGITLTDFIEQLRATESMGGLEKITEKLPVDLSRTVRKGFADDSVIKRTEAIFLSMTPTERAHPNLLKAARKRRVASGAGVDVQQVNRMLNQYAQTNKLMKRAAKNPKALTQMMRSMMH